MPPSIALVAPSLDILGGQGIQARALSDALRREKYSLRFVPINPRFPRPTRWLRAYPYLRTIFNEVLYISSLRDFRQADVVHVFSASYWSFLLAPIPAILAAKLLGKRVILHYHSGEAEDHLNRWRRVVAPFLRLVDEIVVPSSYLQDVFESHGYRARVIPNVIDPSAFQYRERMPLRPRLLSVRNLEHYYRVENTILAFARLKTLFPEATLTIAGYGSQERPLRQLVKRLGVSDVQFVGRVEPAALPTLYDAADIFVNGSVVDNQPVSILEAFAAGLPVVSTPTGDIAAMLGEGEAGLLIAPDDPVSMAEAVTRLLEDPQLALLMARRARSIVERYTWPSVGGQWSNLYTEMMERSTSKSEEAAPKTLSERSSAWRNTFERLIHMEWSEVACRVRQEASKRMERISSVPSLSHRRRRIARQRSSPLDTERLNRFLSNARELFFEGVFDLRVPAALAIGAAAHCKEIVAAADKISRGRFDLLGYADLDFGDPPNWHLDPVSGRQAPVVHWTRLNPLDCETVGDSKVIWELNRHQWLVDLGQAYRLTHEERYAEMIVRSLRSWDRSNAAGRGINWASSLEIGFRLISWSWALLMIRDSPALDPSLFAYLMRSVNAQATHVERYLSYYFSPNTHLTGEALGLLYAGLVFPESKRAKRWRSLAMRVLVQEIERQVLPDGVYFERSTCYQRYTVDIYLHFLILASRAGLEVPSVVSDRVRSMLDFLVTIRHPDGTMPSIGDADGGWLLPLSKIRPEDFRTTFSTAAVFFKNPQYAAAAGQLASDTLWLLGTSAVDIFETLQPTSPPSEDCCVFPAGGFAIMRSGWDARSHSLIFDTGPLGCPNSSGHGHADMLSIQCSVFGRPYIVDAGTCCYTANKELRDFSRSTAAHSTVMVDGKSQAEPAGPFGWESITKAQLTRWIANEKLAFADAEHDGYAGLPNPVSHRRRVIFVKPRYWVLIDDLTGEGSHDIEIRFQFGPMDVHLDPTGWARATHDGRHHLLLRSFTRAPMDADVRVGCRAPLEGWVSPNYGQLEPAPVLVYSTSAALPLQVVTLLWPSEDDEAPSVIAIPDHQGRISGLAFSELAEKVMFDMRQPIVERTETRWLRTS
jgi:glycosyltransferase involved in cell wall biosynthesis